MNPSINDQLKSYGDYLKMKNFSIATHKMYLRTLKRYLRFHDSKFEGRLISQDTVREFVIYRHKQGRLWSIINFDYSSLSKIIQRSHKAEESLMIHISSRSNT